MDCQEKQEVPVYTDVDTETFARDIYPLVTSDIHWKTQCCVFMGCWITHVSCSADPRFWGACPWDPAWTRGQWVTSLRKVETARSKCTCPLTLEWTFYIRTFFTGVLLTQFLNIYQIYKPDIKLSVFNSVFQDSSFWQVCSKGFRSQTLRVLH